ncbi:hypothetical protein [Aureivirga sp. CE67]|uniref:hypothetical protein n=1 Tax=Aureivirga sp. CE67 TaxID=1788983 RepID=UPI0018CBBB4D|nr:hypothetical protein [Aureivirga sp. CE67]
MKEKLLNIYFNSPIWIQNLIISIKGYQIKKNRFSSNFYKELDFYQSLDNKSLHEKIVLEEERLRKFLKNAKNSEYWNSRFLKYNINIDAIDIKKELKKLPILTKDDVRKNIDLIKINKEPLISKRTSGTTGAGLILYETREAENERWAVCWNYRIKQGIKLDQWYGWFGGMKIINSNVKKPPFWRINYPEKRVMFSAQHLNENTVDDYANKILKQKLEWLHGYPSQISLFAALVKDKNYDFSFVKNITFGSENLLENQKILIRKVFENAVLSEHYCMTECVSNISQHSNEELYLDRYFSYTEFIPTDIKNKYWIVGTNLSNPNFPLIRYNTNDIVEIIGGQIISIDGRKEDYVILKNGTKLGRLDHIFKGLIHIKEAQIYQPDFNNVVIRIVKSKSYDNHNEEKKLIKKLDLWFKNEINFKIEYLDKIERTKSNKLRFVVSEIKNKQFF